MNKLKLAEALKTKKKNKMKRRKNDNVYFVYVESAPT